MFPFELLSSEASAANLLEQVRWRDGLYCPRCRSESVIKHGSYRTYQRYLCKDCDRTFNPKTGTIFARDAWLSPHQGVSKDKLTPYLRAFQLRRRILRKPGQEALKDVVRTVL